MAIRFIKLTGAVSGRPMYMAARLFHTISLVRHRKDECDWTSSHIPIEDRKAAEIEHQKQHDREPDEYTIVAVTPANVELQVMETPEQIIEQLDSLPEDK